MKNENQSRRFYNLFLKYSTQRTRKPTEFHRDFTEVTLCHSVLSVLKNDDFYKLGAKNGFCLDC